MTIPLELARLREDALALQREATHLQHTIRASIQAQITATGTLAGAAALGALAAFALPTGGVETKATSDTVFSRAIAATSSLVGTLAKVIAIKELLSSNKSAASPKKSPEPPTASL